MRECLFRGKRLDNGEWVEGSLLLDGEAHKPINKDHLSFSKSYIVPETALDNINAVLNDGAYILQTMAYHVIPETVSHFTGLTDKNGVKIFEGDVVKSDNGTMAAAVFVVCYGVCRPKMYRRLLENYYRMEPRCMDFGLFGRSVKTGEDVILTDATQLFEVIGNIHDNPELLREGAKCNTE